MRSPVYEPLSDADPRGIGGYRVVARLGAGGMGRVFLATTQSGRRLAIKIIRPEFADDPEFRRRFAQEVTAAQRVQNFYTAPVIDADLTGPMPWLATAHIPGPSLATAIHESGPLPVDTLRTLAAGVAEALQAIHRAGIVHRDLKPSNVLLAADGPRVIDFGIARAADATPLTRTNGAIGSPQFMAPEQIRGGEPTPALDVFAFGALLFFAATARSPFGDGPAQAVMYRIAQEEPRLDGCPDELKPLIRQCLDKDPAARPTTERLLTELTGVPAPTSTDWLPETLTAALRGYSAVPEPAPPVSLQPTAPGGASSAGFPGHPPSAPHVPIQFPHRPGSPPPAPGGGRTALLLGSGAVVLVLLAALFFVLSQKDDGNSSDDLLARQPGTEDLVRPPTAESTPPTGTPDASATVADPSASDTSGPGTMKPAGTFLSEHKGIDITDGYSIYFTDDPLRPKKLDWNAYGKYQGDLAFGGSGISGESKFGAIEAGQPADYETCHANTKYIENGLGSPAKGSIWCVYTDTDLLGIITVKSIDADYLTIDLKVWQGPAD
ncbi:serine/threonine-protein kinase [Actinocorallia populi]|uniref:serine/threonine-protein kinase n=1 Tax=Actinocorallia populi TaxID=2079200 RepID=UPI000D08D02A|nr:serine/threonine-protein kinase [Actinocorallia populi]